MRSGARLLQLLRPYSLLFTAAILATVLASVLDGFTIALLIPFLRTLFGQQALGPAGGSAVQAVLARLTGALITAGGPPGGGGQGVGNLLVAVGLQKRARKAPRLLERGVPGEGGGRPPPRAVPPLARLPLG